MTAIDPTQLRAGHARARYFRENYAQAGIDLSQIIPELVTNADAAIAASGRAHGRITISFRAADIDFVKRWRSELRPLDVPALTTWKHELHCIDDGEGVDADSVDRRLGALGVTPDRAGQRGLFGRGLRDVWLAQGGGRIEGVRDGRAVETWFFPSAGDEPYMYVHVRDEPATSAHLRDLGSTPSGTRIVVPLAQTRLPSAGRLRRLVSQLVQIRPVLEDPSREVMLELPGDGVSVVVYPAPEPDPERPVLFDDEVEVDRSHSARIVVRRAATPFTLASSRNTRLGGLVIRSGRAAHESTLAGLEGCAGSRRLYGDVYCEAIETLQRSALDSPRPEVVVRVDRSGLNENHPFVAQLNAAIVHVLRPIVADEERRAGARMLAAGRAIKARDQEGLRALNLALNAAFDSRGRAGGMPGAATVNAPVKPEPRERPDAPAIAEAEPAEGPPDVPMRFRRSPVRLHPGEQRGVTIIFDPGRVPPGTPVELVAEDGITGNITGGEPVVPPVGRGGWCSLALWVRARVSTTPGSRLRLLAAAGEHEAELEVLIVRHTGSGWVREIARKDEDAVIEAEFDPDSGVVTVFEGRAEFKALERAARRAGHKRAHVREYPPYRMLEVEAAANAVYSWAAHEIVAQRAAEGTAFAPAEHAREVTLEAQSLRHRAHAKLMQAFLEPEVFEGRVRVDREGEPAQGQLIA